MPAYPMEPPREVTFDGNPDKLVLFLNHVQGHLDRYALAYLTQRAIVNMVEANLKGEAAEWVGTLHDEDAPELRDAGMFLWELRIKFEDEAKAQWAEGEIRELNQRGQPMKEYI